MDKSNCTGLQVALPGLPTDLQEGRDALYSLHKKSVLANKRKFFSLFLFLVSDVLDHAEVGLVPIGVAIYSIKF